MSRPTMPRIWKDGENIPPGRLNAIFKPPPALPANFDRSGILVGAKGSGKTTLFRHLQRNHDGFALLLSLATELASIARQAAVGPLAIELPVEVETLIQNKTAALLALSVAGALAAEGINAVLPSLRWCLPEPVQAHLHSGSLADLQRAKSDAASRPLQDFESLSYHTPLRETFAAFGERTQADGRELLVLLDRADAVPAPALLPILDLLDQSRGYVMLVATRPGHGAFTLARLRPEIVAGDQFDVHYLGLQPYSDEWYTFVLEAVAAQVSGITAISDTEKMTIISLGRDSIRWSLETLDHAAQYRSPDRTAWIAKTLDVERAEQIEAVDQLVHKYFGRFRSFLHDLRQQIDANSKRDHPTVIVFQTSDATQFSTETRLAGFIETGLRNGGLCMEAGTRWRPGAIPTRLEVPPLFLWRSNDGVATLRNPPYFVQYSPRQFFALRWKDTSTPTLFVAFRMKAERSRHLVESLRAVLKGHPTFASWQVVTGESPPGTNWPEYVRAQIRKATIVVGDVTGARPDVLFEMGFAYGLRRPMLPITIEPGATAALPYWFRGIQVGTYLADQDLLRLAADIEAHVLDPAYSKTWRAPLPLPSTAVWLGTYEWNLAAREQFRALCEREGMAVHEVSAEDPGAPLIRRCASASLLVIALDGSLRDALMHYVAGAVVSRTRMGVGAKVFYRRLLIVELPGGKAGQYAAPSLRRCAETAHLTTMSGMHQEITAFLERYNRWATS